MKKHASVIAAAVIIVLACFFLVQSFYVKQETTSPLGPGFWPKLLCIGIIILGVVDLTTELKRLDKRKDSEEKPTERGLLNWIKNHPDWSSWLLMLVYAISMKYLGFVLASIIYSFLQIYLFTFAVKRNYLLYALISICFPIAVYFVFINLFNLLLPTGFLGFM